MPDDRDKRRKYVRAAKHWLGEAEESLDKEEDLKSELHVMLAKAELLHAEENAVQSSMLSWAKRLLPLFVAGLIACAFFFLLRKEAQVKPEFSAPPLKTTVTETKPLPKEKFSEEKQELKMERADEADIPENKAIGVFEQEKMPREKVDIPTVDMQKLMNTAGKSLRSQ